MTTSHDFAGNRENTLVDPVCGAEGAEPVARDDDALLEWLTGGGAAALEARLADLAAVDPALYQEALFALQDVLGNAGVSELNASVCAFGKGSEGAALELQEAGSEMAPASAPTVAVQHSPAPESAATAVPNAPVATATTKRAIVVRTGPGTKHPRTSAQPNWVDAGFQFDVLAVSGAWLQVLYLGAPAFITGGSNYVDVVPVPAPETGTVPDGQSEETTATGGLLDVLSGAVATAVGTVVDTVSGVLDAGVELVTSLFSEPVEPTAEERPQLEHEAAHPEPDLSTGDSVFLNQRDNEFEDTDTKGESIHGDNLCSVTSQTMQLIALLGSEQAVKTRAAELIAEHGGTPASDLATRQTEDVVMDFYDVLRDTGYWHTKAGEKTGVFYHRWTNESAFVREVFHQMGVCQAHVNQLFGLSSRNASRDQDVDAGDLAAGATLRDFHEANLAPRLANGEAIMLSTSLTANGGHVVVLVAVEADGVVLNDPYGARRSDRDTSNGYLLHGDNPSAEWDSEAVHTERFKHNPTLLQALRDGKELTNWGERNFFSWAEVEKWSIGDAVTTATTGDLR